MRIFYSIIFFVAICVIVIFAIGIVAPEQYEQELSATYDYKIDKVWNILTSVENYPLKKNNLLEIEVLNSSYGRIFEWREIYSDKIMKYKVLEKNPYYYRVEVEEDDFYKGVWEYYLEFTDKTKLTIVEKSVNTNIWERGVDTILRRNQYINSEFKWIRVSLLNDLIYEL